MNTSESISFLSDALLDDERIVTIDEREFLAELLRLSESNPKQLNSDVTQAIAEIAGEIVGRRRASQGVRQMGHLQLAPQASDTQATDPWCFASEQYDPKESSGESSAQASNSRAANSRFD